MSIFALRRNLFHSADCQEEYVRVRQNYLFTFPLFYLEFKLVRRKFTFSASLSPSIIRIRKYQFSMIDHQIQERINPLGFMETTFLTFFKNLAKPGEPQAVQFLHEEIFITNTSPDTDFVQLQLFYGWKARRKRFSFRLSHKKCHEQADVLKNLR